MTTTGLDRALAELLDRQAIEACIHRYTRGVDRLDEELLFSAFHEDALDFHTAEGRSPQAFFDWYRSRPARLMSQHYVTNVVLELDGDVAHGEAYWTAVARIDGSEGLRTSGGRYVARFERRDGEWRIAIWVVVAEWVVLDDGPQSEMLAGKRLGRRDRSDLSYARPLAPAAAAQL